MESVTVTIRLIQTCLSTYWSFKALKEECRSFRNLLLSVSDILEDIQQQFQEGSLHNTKLPRPLGMLQMAVRDGQSVLDKCAKQKTVKALVFSKQHLGTLAKASDAIKEALGLISASGVSVQGKMSRKMDEVKDLVGALQNQIQHHNHDVAEMVRRELETSSDHLADRIFNRLSEKGVVSDRRDFDEQIQAIQEEREKLLAEKVIYDRQIMDAVLSLSLSEGLGGGVNEGNEVPNVALDSLLKCPLSLDYMHDPVVLTVSGVTYDRELLCESLLTRPNLEPSSNERYDQPLQYADNVAVRAMIMERFGDQFYRRYDDSQFHKQYKAAWRKWQERLCPPDETSVGRADLRLTQADPNVEILLCEVMVCLYGLNSRQISPKEAQSMLDKSTSRDARILAFQACLLHPEFGKGYGMTQKNEAEAHAKFQEAADQRLEELASSCDPLAQLLMGHCMSLHKKDDGLAVYYYLLAADQGHADAQFNLGLMYHNGQGVSQNDQEAIQYYKLAVDQGHAGAQYNLGWMYVNGQVVSQNDQEAFRYFKLAADQGYASAQYNLGWMYVNGQGVSHNDQEAFRYFKLAADQGHTGAQNALGWMYDSGRGVSQNVQEAIRYYKLAADQGHADAQYNLGLMYRNGQGVSQNDQEAIRYYKLAADQGNAPAQCNLGWMYLKGRGVSQNDKEAVQYYKLAADQGNASAQCNLGVMYDNGQGVSQNDKEAFRYYKLAADQGHAAAQNNLGFMYQNGRGVSQNDHKAFRYYKLAADQGHASAQYNLGNMYENGQGVPQNDKEAMRYFKLAADQGDADAQKRLDKKSAKRGWFRRKN